MGTTTETTVELAPGKIAASPFQPRVSFPAAELKDLAESIKRVGMIEPVVVRLVDGKRHELIAGERRVRAAKLARLKKIPAVVRTYSDDEAAEACFAENMQRKDLNVVEEAAWYRAYLERTGITQGELAKKLNMDQSTIANRMRLLKLPKHWQEKIISGEITPTNGRDLLTVAHCQPVLDLLAKQLKGYRGDQPSNEDWREEIGTAIRRATEPMSGAAYAGSVDGKYLGYVKVFKPTDNEREKLGIVDLPGGFDFHRGMLKKTEPRATNTKLWKKLLAAHAKQLAARRAKSNGKARGAAKKPKATPAQKAKAEADKRWQFQRRLYGWKIDWLQYLCAREIGTYPTVPLRVAAFFAMSTGSEASWREKQKARERLELAEDVLRSRHVKLAKRKGALIGSRLTDIFGAFTAMADGEFEAAVLAIVKAWLWDEKNKAARGVLPDFEIETLAADLEIDLAKAWEQSAAGPYTEAFFELHTKDQLLALGKELKTPMQAAATKKQMIGRFLAVRGQRIWPLPKEIKKAKPTR